MYLQLQPRRIAVQLSNDLYRLITPKLMRRGVTVETEIEYRVGPYFVLAVNIKTIDWRKLIKSTHKDAVQRQARWERERRKIDTKIKSDSSSTKQVSVVRNNFAYFQLSFNLSVYDVIERTIAILYYLHWTIYLPICWMSYYTFLGPSLRQFILTTVADEVFYYVEEKGMDLTMIMHYNFFSLNWLLNLYFIRIQEWKWKLKYVEPKHKQHS
jgi:hypothetical protein